MVERIENPELIEKFVVLLQIPPASPVTRSSFVDAGVMEPALIEVTPLAVVEPF
jgi:hypothetical protein